MATLVPQNQSVERLRLQCQTRALVSWVVPANRAGQEYFKLWRKALPEKEGSSRGDKEQLHRSEWNRFGSSCPRSPASASGCISRGVEPHVEGDCTLVYPTCGQLYIPCTTRAFFGVPTYSTYVQYIPLSGYGCSLADASKASRKIEHSTHLFRGAVQDGGDRGRRCSTRRGRRAYEPVLLLHRRTAPPRAKEVWRPGEARVGWAWNTATPTPRGQSHTAALRLRLRCSGGWLLCRLAAGN